MAQNVTGADEVADNSLEWEDLDEQELLRCVESASQEAKGKRRHSEEKEGDLAEKPYRRRHDVSLPPLTRFRHGYLWVSDLSKQSWCEQQMEYSFVPPVEMEIVEKPVMTTGSNLHLARELEVHDIVKIEVTSDEDILAIKILNLLGAITALLHDVPICREIPIFGAPFDKGVFLMGMIDEIRADADTFSFDILEFKTRQSNSIPSKAQKTTHAIQVMIYKKLFDDLIRGNTNKDLLVKHLEVKMDVHLGKSVLAEAKKQAVDATSLGGLLDVVFERVQSMPCISQLLVEYCYQEGNSTIGIETVVYDEAWLEERFDYFTSYWQGKRQAVGVEIEEAWKCHHCDFTDVCEWRLHKEQECINKNKHVRNKNT